MEEQENLSNVLEINHQLPRAEGGNIGRQPARVYPTCNRTQEAKGPQ